MSKDFRVVDRLEVTKSFDEASAFLPSNQIETMTMDKVALTRCFNEENVKNCQTARMNLIG